MIKKEIQTLLEIVLFKSSMKTSRKHLFQTLPSCIWGKVWPDLQGNPLIAPYKSSCVIVERTGIQITPWGLQSWKLSRILIVSRQFVLDCMHGWYSIEEHRSLYRLVFSIAFLLGLSDLKSDKHSSKIIWGPFENLKCVSYYPASGFIPCCVTTAYITQYSTIRPCPTLSCFVNYKARFISVGWL